MTHARNPRLLRVSIENVGKSRLDQDGKYRVNENDEEILLHRADTGRGSPFSSLRANGSRECAPDDRLREAIQFHEKAGLLRRYHSSQ
jgi:hypothetical protein